MNKFSKVAIILLIGLIFTLTVFAQDLVVGSYNIRYDNSGDVNNGHAWVDRYPWITKQILFNDFDVIGTQEVLNHQLLNLTANLPGYDYVGVGRDDGKTEGEYAPIFYKKERMQLLKSGHFWLSEETTYPNKGWDAVLPRICTWAQFKDKKTKKKVWYFNLHMDHVGVQARRESAKLVLAQIKEMCGKDFVVLTGDFNVDQTHESYSLLADSKVLEDSYSVAKIQYAPNGTFNAYHPDGMTTSRIDHVFVSPNFIVDRYGVLTDTYRTPLASGEKNSRGDFPKEVFTLKADIKNYSDHYPIKVVLTYK